MDADLLSRSGPDALRWIAAWVLTYLVHSTLALTAAWWLARMRWADRAREALWKSALLAGIVSASWQVSSGIHLLSPVWPIAIAEAPRERPVPTAEPVLAAPTTATEPSLPEPGATGRLSSGALALWGLSSLAVLGIYVVRRLRLGRLLRDQREVEDGPLARELAALCARAGYARRVALYESPHLGAPIAYGILRPRIVLPRRALAELSAEQQASIVAHELAHLVHGDPGWLLVLRVVESLLFFQPLNHLARRKLEEIAEYRCDAWAVWQLGSNVPLASCLVEVASWLRSRPHRAVVPAMASGESSLSRRVHRLLDDGALASRPSSSKLAQLGLTALVLVLACAAPGFSAWEVERPRARQSTGSSVRDAALACDLLDAELVELDGELAELREVIAAARDPGPYLPSLHSIVGRARELRLQHARLVSWLNAQSAADASSAAATSTGR